jgi:hypothetical protein
MKWVEWRVRKKLGMLAVNEIEKSLKLRQAVGIFKYLIKESLINMG